MKTLLVILITLVGSGCTAKVNLTYNTSPQGAKISSRYSNRPIGTSPVTATFVFEKKDLDERKCLKTEGVTATWVSGVQVQTKSLDLCFKKGTKFFYNIDRPANAPGLEKDMRFALDVEKNKILLKQISQENRRQLILPVLEFMGTVGANL